MARSLVSENTIYLDLVWLTGKVIFYPIKHLSIYTDRLQLG